MSIKHPEKELIKCPECKFSAIQDSDLTQHVKAKHSGDRPFTCSRCDETFKTKSHLKVHLVTHGEKPFKCQYCEFSCSEASGVRNHISTHIPFVCQFCEYSVDKMSQLKSHIYNIHSTEKLHRCEQCGFSAKKSSNLKKTC